MNIFKAIGYHGTDDAGTLLGNGIDYKRPAGDVFLGRGFYLWRDSFQRAFLWKGNREDVLKVECECLEDEMLNFTSTNWNNEKDIIRLYLKNFKPKQIYFGEFLDFLIDELGVDIKLITIMDLKNKITKLHIQDPLVEKNRTIFSHGDIQICVKHKDVSKSIQKVLSES